MKKILIPLLALLTACSATIGSGTLATQPVATSTSNPSITTTNPSPTSSTTVPGQTTTTAVRGETTLKVYYFMETPTGFQTGPHLVPVTRVVPETKGVLKAAIEQLLAGPSDEESNATPEVTTAIPEETILLDVNLANGVATIDLSREFESGGGSASVFGRLAQVVYTATQFPTVQNVVFHLDGEPVEVFSGEGVILDGPVDRDDYLDQLPILFVDGPAYGGILANPARIVGKANAFEATLQIGIYDEDGTRLVEEHAMATCGTGCWGDFDVTLSYEVDKEQLGILRVWEASAQDGSAVNIREYPVWLTP